MRNKRRSLYLNISERDEEGRILIPHREEIGLELGEQVLVWEDEISHRALIEYNGLRARYVARLISE